tara:strand:- start:4652 stop:5803 length:1152 start_codon:yes stop_codon:yes gene_type:complete
MMRIAIVHYWDVMNPGGINSNILKSSIKLGEMGNQVLILQPRVSENQGGKISESVEVICLEPPRFSPPFNYSRRFIEESKVQIENFNPQILHIHSHMNLLSHAVIGMANRNFHSIPIVFSPHFDTSLSTKSLRLLFPLFNLTAGRRSSKKVDHLIFNSNYEKRAYEKNVDMANHYSIISPGVDWNPTSRNRIWNEELKLIYCGHAIKRKRPERFVKLISSLCSSTQEMEIRIKGKFASEGPELEKCKRLARQLGVFEKIEWLPFLKREIMIREISNSDYFVLLSDSEAYGISVAEAISLGTPVIISNNTALSEFSTNRGVIMVDNPDHLDSTVREILSMRSSSIRVGTTEETNIVSWQSMAEKLLETFEESVNQSKNNKNLGR